MVAAAKVTLKLHRAELGLASLLALAVAALAAYLTAPSGLAAFETYVWTTLAVLPFGLGLITGVPIVSRELEGGTAQLAWSLYGSRIRWFLRQSLPLLVVLGTCLTLTAWAASALVVRPNQHPEAPFANIGSYGVALLARAFGAFCLGAFVGALVGRALPALVLGALLCFGIVTATSGARDAWFADLGPRVPMAGMHGFIQTGTALLAPDGKLLSVAEAIALVPQGVGPEVWLEEHGYGLVDMGVPLSLATAWNWYDSAIFVVTGCVSAVAAGFLVHHKRPS